MQRFRLLLDSNLLVLLIVGIHDPTLISKHKRLEIFEKADFDRLSIFCEYFVGGLVVTPNTLTEALTLFG